MPLKRLPKGSLPISSIPSAQRRHPRMERKSEGDGSKNLEPVKGIGVVAVPRQLLLSGSNLWT